MIEYTRAAYDVLNKIYREKSYSSQALYRALEGVENAELIHRIVLGVLDKNVELEYIISQLVTSAPKPAVAIVLKQGIYCLKYMDGIPDYAVINNHVELIKQLGKHQLSGFINAVLRAARDEKYSYPLDSDVIKYNSVKFSKPEWLVEKLMNEYGFDTMVEILSAEPLFETHIRPNLRVWNVEKLEEFLDTRNVEYRRTEVGGLLVKLTPEVKKLFRGGEITYQSVTSMLAVEALDVADGCRVLDLCSAPGGKAVYISELNQSGSVVACDVYSHRVGLVASYAKRMDAKNVETELLDATVYEHKFLNGFDRVLVDAPCSALGITRKEPDILLNRKPEDIEELQRTQKFILSNAAKYLRRGGILVYSTCTVTKEENGEVIADFLTHNEDFALKPIEGERENDGTLQYFPKGETDGFFIARMVKK